MKNTINVDQDAFKTGNEVFTFDEKPIATLRDFWRWAYSDFTDTAENIKLAEYLVRLGLGCLDVKSTSGFHDVFWEEQGVKIGVETDALGSLKERGQVRLFLPAGGDGGLQRWDDSAFADYQKAVNNDVDVRVLCSFTPPYTTGCEPYPFDLTKWSFRVISESESDAGMTWHYRQNDVTLEGLADAVKEAAWAKKNKVDGEKKKALADKASEREYVNALVVQFEGRDIFVPIPEWSGSLDDITQFTDGARLVIYIAQHDMPLVYELDAGTSVARRV